MPLCGTIKKLDFSFNLICIGGGTMQFNKDGSYKGFKMNILVKISAFESSLNSKLFMVCTYAIEMLPTSTVYCMDGIDMRGRSKPMQFQNVCLRKSLNISGIQHN